MQLIGIQLDIVWEDKAANFAKVRELAAAARPEPGALLVLPEMFSTGFSMNVDGIHESPARETGSRRCCRAGISRRRSRWRSWAGTTEASCT